MFIHLFWLASIRANRCDRNVCLLYKVLYSPKGGRCGECSRLAVNFSTPLPFLYTVYPFPAEIALRTVCSSMFVISRGKSHAHVTMNTHTDVYVPFYLILCFGNRKYRFIVFSFSFKLNTTLAYARYNLKPLTTSVFG